MTADRLVVAVRSGGELIIGHRVFVAVTQARHRNHQVRTLVSVKISANLGDDPIRWHHQAPSAVGPGAPTAGALGARRVFREF